jgi:hypothetical protein
VPLTDEQLAKANDDLGARHGVVVARPSWTLRAEPGSSPAERIGEDVVKGVLAVRAPDPVATTVGDRRSRSSSGSSSSYSEVSVVDLPCTGHRSGRRSSSRPTSACCR